MINHANIHILSNEHGNNASLSPDVREAKLKVAADIGRDRSSILLDLLFVIDVGIVGLGNLKDLVRGVQFVVVVVIVPEICLDELFVYSLLVSCAKLDHDFRVLRD